MGDLAKFNSSILQSINAANNTYSQLKEEQAKYEASNIQIRLEREANDYMNELQKSNKYETWNDDLTNFFEKRKSEMENPDSPYYCRNNQTAKYVNSMLDQAYNSYQNKVTQMAAVKIRDMNITKYNESCDIIDQTKTGQENIDQKNALARGLWEKGDIDTSTYKQLLDKNYYTGTMMNYTSNFSDDIINAAIKKGNTFDETWDIYSSSIEKTKNYTIEGLEQISNDKDIKEQAKQQCQQKYNAKLAAVQLNNFNGHQSNFAEIDSALFDISIGKGDLQKSVQSIYQKCNIGLNIVNQQDGIQLAKGEQKTIADQYLRYQSAVEDLLEANKTGNAKKAAAAVSKFNPDTFIEYFVNGANQGETSRYGGASTVYGAREIYEEVVLAEYRKQPGKENATWNDMATEYPKVNTFIEYAKKNLPPEMQSIVSNTENILKEIFNNKDNKQFYESEYKAVMDQVYDLLFETDIASLDNVSRKELTNQINKIILSNYGSILSKKQKQQLSVDDYVSPDTLSDYRETMNQNKTMARAINERDANPQLIYTDAYGKTKRSGTPEIQEGLIRLESDERKVLADTLGIDDPKTIKSEYEAEGPYDRSARNIYTVNGNDYRFKSIDKNNYVLETKKNGTNEWKQINTKKQQDEYDKPESVINRYIKEKDISKLPPINKKVPVGGGYLLQLNQDLWNTRTDKEALLLEWYKSDPEAAEKYFNSLPDKKREVNPIKDRKKK